MNEKKMKKRKTYRNLILSFVTTPISISFGFKSVDRTFANVEIANYKRTSSQMMNDILRLNLLQQLHHS